MQDPLARKDGLHFGIAGFDSKLSHEHSSSRLHLPFSPPVRKKKLAKVVLGPQAALTRLRKARNRRQIQDDGFYCLLHRVRGPGLEECSTADVEGLQSSPQFEPICLPEPRSTLQAVEQVEVLADDSGSGTDLEGWGDDASDGGSEVNDEGSDSGKDLDGWGDDDSIRQSTSQEPTVVQPPPPQVRFMIGNGRPGLIGSEPFPPGFDPEADRESARDENLAEYNDKHHSPEYIAILEDEFLSQKHFKVARKGKQFQICDLGSQNGTFLRKESDARNEGKMVGRRLRAGMIIVIGKYSTINVIDVTGIDPDLNSDHARDSVASMSEAELVATDGDIHNETDDTFTPRHSNPTPFVVGTPRLHLRFSCKCSEHEGGQGVYGAEIVVTSDGAVVGKCSTLCDIHLPDPSLLDMQARIQFIPELAAFYIQDTDPSSQNRFCTRLSPSGEPSERKVLSQGDLIVAGKTHFQVGVRGLPKNVQSRHHCTSAADIGHHVHGNWAKNKEQQDRAVALDGFGDRVKNGFFAVFDGHSNRLVADYCAASLPHHVLQQLQRRVWDHDSDPLPQVTTVNHTTTDDAPQANRPEGISPARDEDPNSSEPSPSCSSNHTSYRTSSVSSKHSFSSRPYSFSSKQSFSSRNSTSLSSSLQTVGRDSVSSPSSSPVSQPVEPVESPAFDALPPAVDGILPPSAISSSPSSPSSSQSQSTRSPGASASSSSQAFFDRSPSHSLSRSSQFTSQGVILSPASQVQRSVRRVRNNGSDRRRHSSSFPTTPNRSNDGRPKSKSVLTPSLSRTASGTHTISFSFPGLSPVASRSPSPKPVYKETLQSTLEQAKAHTDTADTEAQTHTEPHERAEGEEHPPREADKGSIPRPEGVHWAPVNEERDSKFYPPSESERGSISDTPTSSRRSPSSSIIESDVEDDMWLADGTRSPMPIGDLFPTQPAPPLSPMEQSSLLDYFRPPTADEIIQEEDRERRRKEQLEGGHRKVKEIPLAPIPEVTQILSLDTATEEEPQGTPELISRITSAIATAYQLTGTEVEGFGQYSDYGGSTAVTCLVWDDAESRQKLLFTAHIGDSRAYLMRDGYLFQLTRDHRPSNEAERERIGALGKVITGPRLGKCLAVTRAFGDLRLVEEGLSSKPHISVQVLDERDTYLILSSDGLFEGGLGVLSRVMGDGETTRKSATHVSKALIDEALKCSQDNLSAVVVQLQRSVEPAS